MAKILVTITQLFIILMTQFLFIAGYLTPFDSQGYNACFSQGGFEMWEPGFQLICGVTSSIDNQFYSLALGRLISIFPTIILFIILSKKNLYASIYLFFALYGLVLGGYRQLIAASILGIILIISDNYRYRKIVLSCIAFITHYSTIPATFIYLLVKKIKYTRVKYLITILAILLVPTFIHYFLIYEIYSYLKIPYTWFEYLSGEYKVTDNTYYLFAKLIIILQSICAILFVSLSKPMMVSQASRRTLIIFESLFIAITISIDYVITARFGIFIRLFEMKYIMMESYGKTVKLALIAIVFARLGVLLYGSDL